MKPVIIGSSFTDMEEDYGPGMFTDGLDDLDR